MLDQIVEIVNVTNGNPLVFLLVVPFVYIAVRIVWDALNIKY